MAANFSAEARHAFVIEIGAGHVYEFGSLGLDGGDNFGVAVSRGTDRNACGKVQEHIAVHVFDYCAASALRYQRVIAGVRGRHEFLVGFEHALGVGSGQFGEEPGKLPIGLRIAPSRAISFWIPMR